MKAKERIARILQEAGYKNVQIEKQLLVYTQTYQGPKPRFADVYAERIYPSDKVEMIQMFSVEIDGKYHSKGKDNRRNADLELVGVSTVRIPLDWFKRGATTDSQLLQHIEYQLQK